MKFRTLVLFGLICSFLGIANAGDRISFYIECSPGQSCIDLTSNSGMKQSVLATPAQELTRADIQSASIQTGGSPHPSLNLELSKEASEKLERITGGNIGKKLVIVFDGRILTAPTINQPITSKEITISGGEELFWEKAAWLQAAITTSNAAGGRRAMVYMTIAAVVLIAAAIFLLLPRIRPRQPNME